MSITTEKEAWEAVRKNGLALKDVPKALKTPELCLAAVKHDPWGYPGGCALNYVPEALKTPKLCLAAVKHDPWGCALNHVPEALKTYDLCLAAVKHDGLALCKVPKALKTPELCLAAVKQKSIALNHVPEALKTPELCLAAVKHDGLAIWYVPKALKTPELCLAAVKQSGLALNHVPEALKTPKLCLAAVKHDPWGCALNHVPEALKTYDLCLAAVKHDPHDPRDRLGQRCALNYVPEALKTYDLCLAAVKQNEKAIIYVPKGLRAKIKAATQPKRRGKACLAPLAVPTKTVKGKFTDPRDGKVYKTVKIGKQVWFAENLNFDCKGSKCYNDDPKNVEKYGRLYDWKTAKKACPRGWHLPSNEEWNELVDFAGGKKIAGKKLKAKSGWNENGKGTDSYGFSALPGGYDLSDGSFDDVGDSGNWWSANEYLSYYAYNVDIENTHDSAHWGYDPKTRLFSVRCVQDKVLPKGIRRGKKK